MSDRMIILFDGECTFCAGVVRFILPRDRRGVFQFAPRASEAGRRILAELATGELPPSILLVDGRTVYARSDASLRIARHLPFPWPLLGALRVIPRPIRDWAYALFARHRHRFARGGTCALPTADYAARFLPGAVAKTSEPR